MNHTPFSTPLKYSKLERGSSSFIAYNRLDKKNKNLPEILFLGGFFSDMTGTKATFIESLCENRGQTYTRFDYFGHGSSSGSFAEGTIGQWLSDALAMIDEVTKGPLILVGSSMGGWLMTLAALARPERVKALIGIASAPDFTEELVWASLNESQRKDFIRQGMIQTPSQYEQQGFPITLQLIEEGRGHLVLPKAIDIHCPVHLIHGNADKDVPWSLSSRLAQRIKSPEVTLTLIKNGDHRLTSPLALGRLASVLNEVSQLETIN
ncbi:MAG TPA: alpha/beta hydrolase [Alphaproteobacteria bacterium]|nr:alpha/beta hydrolase [Alphaproteobacteria bacterium]